MKLALYVENNEIQLIITPETKQEQAIMAVMDNEEIVIQKMKGEFYLCRGGYIVNALEDYPPFQSYNSHEKPLVSFILKMKKRAEDEKGGGLPNLQSRGVMVD